ncbi:lysM domain-containing GPI-anchored protein 2-like [Humulus lupulus]|uniref:lysM domain-containing GPI-anchored protein 2-like n=1 Tax=Humulus lupulus TaxID=3486 RepID=UPI002B40E4E9|nr:lysM domain-containing GPI-anchored protein 2-like [Humulus lupulus]
MGSTTYPAILLSLFFISAHLVVQSAAQTPPVFKCSTGAKTTCQGLVDYVVPNATTLVDIQALFGIKKLYTFLGANNHPITTPRNTTVAAKETIKIPFPCSCSNGTGASSGAPKYTVKPGDGLDHIAREIFSNLVSYQRIADVNRIPNVNLIQPGQTFTIPLPCSCDELNGTQVVHYGHVVKTGNTVEGIAQEFGTTEETILKLNGIVNSTEILAGQVLDVPLKGLVLYTRYVVHQILVY